MTPTRRVAVLSPDPESPSGGVERFCRQLADALRGGGWDATLLGAVGYRLTWPEKLGAGPMMHSVGTFRGRDLEGFDLLISPGFFGVGAPRHLPRIQVYQGTMVGHAFYGGTGLSRVERVRRGAGGGVAECLSGLRAVRVAASDAIADELRRFYRLEPHRVIPNGVDLDLYRPRPQAEARARLGLDADRRYALYIGRLESRKGVELLRPACERAGYELMVASTERLPGALHLGVLSPEQCAWAYCAADCVLFPTRYEGCSLLALEALASGVPLVTTRTGWMSSFYAGVPEYRQLAIWPEVDDIAAVLNELAASDVSELTVRARAWLVDRVGLGVFASRWLTLAEEVITGNVHC